jgi:hypothetical protein
MIGKRLPSADGLTVLKWVVERPGEYGLDHNLGSLKNVLEFTIQHPNCVQAWEASASLKIARTLERSQNGSRIQNLISSQLLRVKEDLAWTSLDCQLTVKSLYLGVERYSRLAKSLCVLADLWRYQRHFAQVPLCSATAAAARLARLTYLKQCGWETLQDYLDQRGLDWRADIAERLGRIAEPHCTMTGGTRKTVRLDKDGNAWLVKYSPESLLNPVLASVFARISRCPSAEICPSYLDYDPCIALPCSVQPYIEPQRVLRFDYLSKDEVIRLIAGRRKQASQILCQIVMQWILENIDANQAIIDRRGNVILVDQDRSFFIDDHRVTTDWKAACDARTNVGFSVIQAELIQATARVPGVLEDLSSFIDGVEAIPASVYEGLVRNASFREDQLCNIYYLDTFGSRALESIAALECWISHILERKLTVRAALAKRLREVLEISDVRL